MGGGGGMNRVLSGRHEGDSFDRASRSLLLFTSSGRREGDLFDRASTHEFAANKNPRQNSRDAVAWASYAPMRLHRQNRRGGMPKLPIIARSEPNGGGEVMNKMGRRAHLLAQNWFLVFGLRFRKRGKPQEGLQKEKKRGRQQDRDFDFGKK